MHSLPVALFLRRALTYGLSLAGFAFVLSTASAQQPSPAPASPVPTPSTEGIVFPVPELGGCADIGSCLQHCEDPVNHASCAAYAKEKGFYVDDPVHGAPDDFWKDAEGTLGCNSREACETYCAAPANHGACGGFATRRSLQGGYVTSPEKEAVLAAAKTSLGCDSADACRTFCGDPANTKACTSFAHQVGLRGGEVEEGPGGCTSPETCRLYCSDPNHFGACEAAPRVGGEATFRGPGGCSDAAECRAYCEDNPSNCRAYGPGSNGVYVPIACGGGEQVGPGGVCTPPERIALAGQCVQGGDFWNGGSCSDTPPPGVNPEVKSAYFGPRADMGGCTSPAGCYDYCKDNPGGACQGFDASAPRPPDTYHPHIYTTPGTPVRYEPIAELGGCASPGSCYDYCANNASACPGFDPKAPRPLDVSMPGTYYTPPTDIPYFTPSDIAFYVTPVYYTPPEGSNYTTPAYYTPGMYVTPRYYTPDRGDYTTPPYYTPGQDYPTPTGVYPTPTYPTPQYITPPHWFNYSTPTYYSPPAYVTPTYFTPSDSSYTTPQYETPPAYTTPSYETPPGIYLGVRYTSPTYFTPVDRTYTTPAYHTPDYLTPGGYYTPTYYTPGGPYTTPVYYSPSKDYSTPPYYSPPPGYTTPPPYTTPTYYTPYTTPSYAYPTPGGPYATPPPGYFTPSYYYPTPGSPYPTPGEPYPYPTPGYYSPSYGTPSYAYPTPGEPYAYPTPGGYSTPTYGSPSYAYPTPGYSYPSPSYGTPAYGTPSYSYPSPSYGTPAYGTPSYSYPSPSYGTPAYGTPSYEYPTPSYGTPSYEYPTPSYDYPTPSYGTPTVYTYPTPGVAGAATARPGPFVWLLRFLGLR